MAARCFVGSAPCEKNVTFDLGMGEGNRLVEKAALNEGWRGRKSLPCVGLQKQAPVVVQGVPRLFQPCGAPPRPRLKQPWHTLHNQFLDCTSEKFLNYLLH